LFIADLPRKNQVVINRITEQRRRLRAVRDLLAIGFRRQRRDIRIVEEQAPGGGLSSEAIIFSKVLFPQPEGPVINLNSPARS
jgi:hypothetical protein